MAPGFTVMVTFYNGETEIYSRGYDSDADAVSGAFDMTLAETVEGVTIDAPVSKVFANKWMCYYNSVDNEYIGTFDDTTTVSDVLTASAWMNVKAYAVFDWSSDAKFLTAPTDLESVADSIRTKSGKTDELSFPDGFTSAIDSLPTVTVDGEKVSGDLALKSMTTDLPLSLMPYYFCGGSAVVLNGRIHILGSSTMNNSNTRFNYTNHYAWLWDSWIERAAIPVNYYSGLAVVMDDLLYLFCTVNNIQTVLYRFDPTSNLWSALGELPTDISSSYNVSGCALGDSIYVITNYTYHYSVFQYHDSGWSNAAADVPYSMANIDWVEFDGAIHVLGSYYSAYQTNHYKFDGSTWTSVGKLPVNLSNNVPITVLNNEIHFLTSKNHYKWNGTTWTKLQDVRVAIGGRSSNRGNLVAFDNRLHLLGGENERPDISYYDGLSAHNIISERIYVP